MRIPPHPCGRFRNRRAVLFAAFVALLVTGCAEPIPPEQQAAMSRYQALGGKFLFSNGGYKLNLSRTAVANGDLAHLKDIPPLTAIELQGTRIDNAGLEHLAELKNLKFVDLFQSQVTREGVDSLRKELPDAVVKY